MILALSDHRAPSGAARWTLLAAMLAFSLPPAQAAQSSRKTPAVEPLADFSALSGSRARPCSAAPEPGTAVLGEPSLRRCAWSERIEMLYWDSIPNFGASCLPPQAPAWLRLAGAARAFATPWNAAWSGQSLSSTSGGEHRVAALWRRADGQWSAVVWRWNPSPRQDTRNWQAAHWKKLADAAEKLQASNPTPRATPLMAAWLASSSGKARMVDGEDWRWASNGACLGLRTAGIGQASLHLPHSRDDARLEQRSAMQVLLARRYPAAEWLRPFTLLEPAESGARTGAKFLAVWKEDATLHGQLWIPLRGEGGIVRARISTGAPPGEAVKARAGLVERELTALAHAWEAQNE